MTSPDEHGSKRRLQMTKRNIKRRIGRATRRIAREQRLTRLAQKRRDYWWNVKAQLEGRYALVSDGQLEMEL